jgi:hypothetical protein
MNSMKFITYLTCTILLTSLSCCKGKMKLTDREYDWINAYNEGDTLVFQSSMGEFDTTVIVAKEVFNFERYAETDPDPVTANVWYKNRRLNRNYNPNGDQLVGISKSADQTTLVISYLYSRYIIAKMGDDLYTDPDKPIVFEFDTSKPDRETWQPKKLYWHRKFGLVRYVTTDDVVWIKLD